MLYTTTMIHMDESTDSYSFKTFPEMNVCAFNIEIESKDGRHTITLFMSEKQVARLADHAQMYADDIICDRAAGIELGCRS